jgi:hypothetical protein
LAWAFHHILIFLATADRWRSTGNVMTLRRLFAGLGDFERNGDITLDHPEFLVLRV